MSRFAGRVAVVSGASSGIGLATARQLLGEGATVVAADAVPSPDQDERLVEVVADLATAAGCDRVLTVARRWNEVHVVVNNVGVATTRASFQDVSDQDWYATFDLNVLSAIRLTRGLLPALIAGRHGSIVTVGSTTARAADAHWPDYAASKAALLGLTKALSEEYGPVGVRANCVSPGSIRTPLWDRPGGFSEELADRYGTDVESAVLEYVRRERRIALQRPGTAEEVAAAVCFLASDEARYITGADLGVHGGSFKSI